MQMESPESGPMPQDSAPLHESSSARANRSSPFKEQTRQATAVAEEPTATFQEQEEIQSTDEEIPQPRKTASGRVVRRPLRFKDYVL